MRLRDWFKSKKAKAIAMLGCFAMLIGVGASVSVVSAVKENEAVETKAAGTTTVWLNRPNDYDENNPKIHAWGDSGDTVSGYVEMNYVFMNDDGDGWKGVFKYDLPSGTTAFNFQYKQKNTGYRYSANINLPSNNVTGYYQIDSWYEEGGQWKWNVASYTLHPYTIHYDGNSATSGSVSDTTNYTHCTSNNLAANSYSRPGYTFDGWNTQSDGGGTNYASGGNINLTDPPVGGTLTLYAKWTVINSGVYFKLSSGTSSWTDVYVWGASGNNDWNDSHPATQTTNIDNGATNYWYYADFSVIASTVASPTNIILRNTAHNNQSGDIDLHSEDLAHETYLDAETQTWKLLGFTISFNSNSGSGSMTAQNVPINKAATISTNSFTKTGYSFAGWATSASGDIAYTDHETLSISSVNALFAEKGLGGTLTLYAKWTINSYTVSFDMQSHGSQVASQSINYGGKVTKPSDPTATGYTFGGWYKEDGCTNAWNFSTDTITGARTLYAKWTVHTHTLTWVFNGGTPSGSYTAGGTVAYGTPITYPSTVTKTGYTFSSWSTDQSTMPDSDLTITANFSAQTFTISYDKNGGSGSSMSTSTLTYGSAFTLRTNSYTRDGHKFLSWNTAADGSGTNYVSMNLDAEKVNALFSSGDRTLYAIWESGKTAALVYAAAFNDAIEDACDDDGNTDRDELESAWADQNDDYVGLSSHVKYWLLSSRLAGDKSTGDAFYGKYDYVVGRRGSGGSGWDIEDFLDRNPAPIRAFAIPGKSSGAESPLTLTLWIVLGAGVLGLGAIGTAYFVSKKKKKHQA